MVIYTLFFFIQAPHMSSIACTLGATMITHEIPAVPITPVTQNKSTFTESTDTNGSSCKSRVSGMVSVFESAEFKKEGRLPVPRTSSTGSSLSSRSESTSSTGSAEISQGFYCKSAPPYDCELHL